eukprot:CAMPEP_0172310456 /NCGR_PEP_ID=MMETSP1058-20130122/11494_1 /TAXON_ID=83371 /ORGANISM="Detonula confervacea, Strain CCMP 353" /LENGTH=309 /DNA_ID=CAMNT_0013023263 /DNA_START=52 /DNA_END=978 /DNA_ORIENTATION=-
MSSPYPRPQKQRAPTTLRPLSAELSSLSRSDGSASLVVGNTHVLCAVHGPMAPRISRWEKYDTGVVSVAFSRGLMANSGGGGSASASNNDAVAGDNDMTMTTTTANNTLQSHMKSVPVPPPPGLGATERELEYFLRDALSSCILLEKYPRCVIQVVIQVVQADGSVLGSAVNCAVLALMDAGVAMRGLPVAATCCVVMNNYYAVVEKNEKESKKDNAATIWLDPTAEEESGEGHAIVVVVTDMASSSSQENEGADAGGGIITSFTFGAPLSLKGLLSSVESTTQSSAAMVAFMRLAIEQKVQREVQTLW